MYTSWNSGCFTDTPQGQGLGDRTVRQIPPSNLCWTKLWYYDRIVKNKKVDDHMEQISLGETIKRRRKELNLTQEQLCWGICSSITISSLENGKYPPSYHLVNALLERLDLPTDRYYAVLSKNELDIEALQKKIVACNLRFEHSLGDEKVQARTEALQAHKELEAIHLTCPCFDLNDINRGLYTTNEIKIISHLATVNYYTGNYMAAVEIWRQLYKYIHKHFQSMSPTRANLDIILFNYATVLYDIGQYQEALEIVEEGRRACLDYGDYQCLSGMLEVMADCYQCLGDDKRSKELYYQAYYFSKAFGKVRNAEITRQEIKEYFGLEPEC